MTDPFQTILQAGKRPVNNFPVTSRYYGIGTTTVEGADGQLTVYLQRRFIPSSDTLELITEITVKEGDRLDNLAATNIGDPEQFWQIADANNAIEPEELTDEPGTTLRITQPSGIRTF
jgi:hypothetical protein